MGIERAGGGAGVSKKAAHVPGGRRDMSVLRRLFPAGEIEQVAM